MNHPDHPADSARSGSSSQQSERATTAASELLPFPTRTSLSADEAKNSFVRAEFTSSQDCREHFSMVLRQGWIPVHPRDWPPHPPGLQTAARLILPCEPTHIHLSVQWAALTREIAPADWLRDVLEAQKVEFVGHRLWITPGGTCAEVLARVPTLGQPWILRTTALKDRERIYSLRIWCSEPMYAAQAEDFFLALSSFRLLNPVGGAYAEPLSARTLAVGELECAVGLQLRYPSSWKPMNVDGPASGPDPGPTHADFAEGINSDAVLELHGMTSEAGTAEHAPVKALPRAVHLALGDDGDAGELHIGLEVRLPGQLSRQVLVGLLERLNALRGPLLLEPGTHGPYHSDALNAAGQLWRFPFRSPQTSQTPPPAQAALDPALQVVLIGLTSAWVWVSWLPSPETSPEGLEPGRRAFEIVLDTLHWGHPAEILPAGP